MPDYPILFLAVQAATKQNNNNIYYLNLLGVFCTEGRVDNAGYYIMQFGGRYHHSILAILDTVHAVLTLNMKVDH